MRSGSVWMSVLMLSLAVASARATETQWWTVNTAGDHAKSESRGVVIRPDGTLETGPETRTIALDSLRTVWAMARLADGSVALAGDRGRIDRWVPGQGVKPWAKLGAGQVLALAADGDGVIAGTGPHGLVYRVGAKGDTTLLARTGERYVWGLAPGRGGAWWVATGTRGRLYRWAAGKLALVLDTEESNLTSLVADGSGGAFTGGDSRGRIYAVNADGDARTLFDANEDEIRALARDAQGVLWAAALAGSATTGADSGPAADDDDGPAPQRAAVAGARAVVYRLLPDSAAALRWTSPQPFVFALAGARDGLLAATGKRAGVFRIEGSNAVAQIAAPRVGQVTALQVLPDGGLLAATSNPRRWCSWSGPRGARRAAVRRARRSALLAVRPRALERPRLGAVRDASGQRRGTRHHVVALAARERRARPHRVAARSFRAVEGGARLGRCARGRGGFVVARAEPAASARGPERGAAGPGRARGRDGCSQRSGDAVARRWAEGRVLDHHEQPEGPARTAAVGARPADAAVARERSEQRPAAFPHRGAPRPRRPVDRDRQGSRGRDVHVEHGDVAGRALPAARVGQRRARQRGGRGAAGRRS